MICCASWKQNMEWSRLCQYARGGHGPIMAKRVSSDAYEVLDLSSQGDNHDYKDLDIDEPIFD